MANVSDVKAKFFEPDGVDADQVSASGSATTLVANTTSHSYTFDKTLPIDEIVEEAYERIGYKTFQVIN
jgi:hypothetical protein